MLRAAHWQRHWHRSLSVTAARLPTYTHPVQAPVLIYENNDLQYSIVPSQRGIHNSRNNEGIMNRTIRFGSAVGRRCVTMTAGNVDSVLGTQYMPKIFSFQGDIVKGFWRWYDACYDVKDVVTSSLNYLKRPVPEYYRQHVNYQLVFDSIRGLPVMLCFFIPGGFVVLGSSIFILPAWVVFPRTFWNRDQIQRFIQEQHDKRKKGRLVLLGLLEQYRHADYFGTVESTIESKLNPMLEKRDRQERNYLNFAQLKPFLQKGKTFSLEKLPLPYLQALAEGHGLYFASKLRSRTLLIHKLKKVARNLSYQDTMIKRELLIGYMTQRELDWACFRRGMNPYVNNNRMEMESFLREWLRRSKTIDVEREPAELLFNIAMLPMSPKLRASTVLEHYYSPFDEMVEPNKIKNTV